MMPTKFAVFAALAAVTLLACGDPKDAPASDGGTADGGFYCRSLDSKTCIDGVHYRCEPIPGAELGIREVTEDCEATGEICIPDLGCRLCIPNETGCDGNNVATCNDEGTEWIVDEECKPSETQVCYQGQCKDPCEVAVAARSYLGCEFYAADLDNASLLTGRDASAQQYAIVISNPNPVDATVIIERNDALYGEEPVLSVVDERVIAAGDLEVFELPRREVDGSSSNAQCFVDGPACPGAETCVCIDEAEELCQCRRTMSSDGMNDGTHSALTSQAYRVRSNWPLTAYQFNPLENVSVFSNDASLLVPTSAVGSTYTVVGWPQTIANDEFDPSKDFDDGVTTEDLRASLTIIGTRANTSVTVTLGAQVVKVVGVDGAADLGPGDTVEVTLGAFDVLNLETEGFNADFTGSGVSASQPVSVFVGSEASDAPRFDSYANRQCCADHLEEQLFPDSTLGRAFVIARQPPRTMSLNDAFSTPDSVEEVNETEWVRVVGTTATPATVTTTLPAPWDQFEVGQNQDVIVPATQDFLMESSRAVAVLQILPSQMAVGIPSRYPGGDPSIIAVPPSEQFRREYVFLTPDKYAFDFVTIMTSSRSRVLLDGVELTELLGDKVSSGPACSVSPADGRPRAPGDPEPEDVIYRCQLSFPDVESVGPSVDIDEGEQNDGVHTLVSSRPAGLIVYGFDAFVSYGYAGGLDLALIN
jgi:hypothetical protein